MIFFGHSSFMLERLKQMEADFEAANVAVGEATWNIYAGEGKADLDSAQRRLAQVLMNEADRVMVEKWYATIDRRVEPLLTRRLEIWRNSFNGSAVDNLPEIYTLRNRLQKRIATFQFELDGKPTRRSDLQRILRKEPNRNLRQRAWRATAALASANREDLWRLIELRNRKAQELGYRDYIDLILKVQEIDEQWLRQTLARLAEQSRSAYTALIDCLGKEIGVQDLAPWDVAYAMRHGFQLPDGYFPASKALERLQFTAKALGFDIDALLIRTLIRDIPFGGYNVAVRIPGDTRFLVNPSEGHGFYTTTFHEYGHSLQAALTATTWPILKEYEWVTGAHTPAYSEGMGEVMGEFARRPDWLRSVAEVPGEEIERYTSRLLPAQMVMRLFELLLNLRVELAAYTEGPQNLGAREKELTREVRLLEFPSDDPPQWEANTWYVSYPIYWHNYILASLIACQVHESITERFGTNASSNDQVAQYLQENFYESGNSVRWMDRLERGTGKSLGPETYLRRLGVT